MKEVPGFHNDNFAKETCLHSDSKLASHRCVKPKSSSLDDMMFDPRVNALNDSSFPCDLLEVEDCYDCAMRVNRIKETLKFREHDDVDSSKKNQ